MKSTQRNLIRDVKSDGDYLLYNIFLSNMIESMQNLSTQPK